MEEAALALKLDDLFQSGSHQIWTGDFNALTKEDYSDEEWEDIARVRARNLWERPHTELTDKVTSFFHFYLAK